jgi:uncharacterized SAM-binding protein YcdF (DUF218 family)
VSNRATPATTAGLAFPTPAVAPGDDSFAARLQAMLALIKTLLLPPANLLLLGIAGALLRRRSPRLAYGAMAAAIGLLYVISTPLFATWSLSLLEQPYADPLALGEGQAIVALGGGTDGPAAEYGTEVVNHLSMARLRYAAHLQQRSGKPLLVSGGRNNRATISEAQQMRSVLTQEMGVPVRWTEEHSRNTFENALESRRILAPLGIKSIYLVTHAWHLPRARLAFEHAGFEVIPAATEFNLLDPAALGVRDFVPHAGALVKSYYFFHEVLGYAAYSWRTRF